MEKQSPDTEFGNKVLQQFMDLFVSPEVKRRQEIGELNKPLDLRAAQIIFFPDERKPKVRINSEVRAIGKVKFKPRISKKSGEPIFEHEIDGLQEINLTEEDDPDCGHATLIRIGSHWTIAFDFRYNKVLSKKLIETAKQFCDSADYSFKQKLWSPFIDNLFSAAELVAKAVLLSMHDTNLRKKATHRGIQTKFNRFADLGPVKAQHSDTLNKLSGLRDQARYLKGQLTISQTKARELLENVKSMIENVKSLCGY